MTKEKRIKSILGEIDYGFIGYGNLHEDDDEGLMIIKEALELALEKINETTKER